MKFKEEPNLEISLDDKKDHLNELLTDKIGYGAAQQKLVRPLMVLLFSEGCESIVLGLLLPILTKQWGLTVFQQSMIITVVYLGVAFGSYIQVYSDRFGRYTFVTWDALLTTVFGFISCICWNYTSFLVTRFLYGVGIGICLPLSAAYITQVTPAHMRASLICKSRVWWSLGNFFTCILAWFFLASDSWRWLLFVIALPGLYALIQNKLNGFQSLRYLWVQKRTQEVHEMVSYMCKFNQKPLIQKQYLKQLMDRDGQQQRVDLPLKVLFQQKYKASSIRLFCCWFSVCFVQYGMVLLLPLILARVFTNNPSQHNFKYLFLSSIVIVEAVSTYASSFICDNPSIGRKKTVYYGFYIVFAVTCLILLFGQSHKILLFIIFVIIKFVIITIFMTLNSYTAQIYETMIRGKAHGICSVVGRIASSFLGIVGISSLSWFGGNGLYILFVLLSLAAGYSGHTMPYCTSNRPIE